MASSTSVIPLCWQISTSFNPSRAKASAGDVGALDEDDNFDIAIELAVGDVAAVVLLAGNDDFDIAV